MIIRINSYSLNVGTYMLYSKEHYINVFPYASDVKLNITVQTLNRKLSDVITNKSLKTKLLLHHFDLNPEIP